MIELIEGPAALFPCERIVAIWMQCHGYGHDEQHGLFRLLEFDKQRCNAFGISRIQVAGRFVCQDELGFHQEGASHRNAASLSSAQLAGQMPRTVRQANTFQ